MADTDRCRAWLSSGNQCKRRGGYYVNGQHACERHLSQLIRRTAVKNDSGYPWVSVQVLPRPQRRPASPSPEGTP